MSVFQPHFDHVLNNAQEVDNTVLLEHVKHQDFMWENNEPITIEEFNQAVNKLKNHKSPGLNVYSSPLPDSLTHNYLSLTMTDGECDKREKVNL